MKDRLGITDQERADVLTSLGYRRISRKYGIVSRIDRPDWREVLAAYHPYGMAWVNGMSIGEAADHYRRRRSNDKLEIGDVALLVPKSNFDPVGYVPDPGNSAQATTKE